VCDDVLVLVQHPKVYTLGRGAKEADLLAVRPTSDEHEVHRIERGGDVTHHCPGQLVGYPILDLSHYKQDCHWYLRMLEEVIIRVLADYGLTGSRHPEYTGVWVGDAKVCAIGVNVSRWITMHGFALNINCDLSGFDLIVPCGIVDEDKSVTSLQKLLNRPVELQEVKANVMGHFQEIFNTKLVHCVRG
jgi:lipoyl(octanoyl) transferase